MKKVVLFAFNGDLMCFVHVLLNALDMHENGSAVKIVFEGSATKLIPELVKESNPFSNHYRKVTELKLIDCVCKACANKMDALDAAMEQNLPICDELSGHPSMRTYIEQGYDIITF